MIDNKINGLLGLATKAGRLVAGTDATIETIEKKKAKLIILANDSSEKTKNNFEFICKKNHVPIAIWGKIDSLSKTIGKENKAVICIKDKNFANAIYKLICGRDIIE